MTQELISHQELLKLLSYNPETGLFHWRSGRKRQAGTVHPIKGRREINIKKRQYYASRLAWFYVHGYWPIEIDHINRSRGDDRIANLRECSHRQNCANKGLQPNNTSGIRGVTWHRRYKKWQAQIATGGKQLHIGYFTEFDAAVTARRAKAIELYGEFAG